MEAPAAVEDALASLLVHMDPLLQVMLLLLPHSAACACMLAQHGWRRSLVHVLSAVRLGLWSTVLTLNMQVQCRVERW